MEAAPITYMCLSPKMGVEYPPTWPWTDLRITRSILLTIKQFQNTLVYLKKLVPFVRMSFYSNILIHRPAMRGISHSCSNPLKTSRSDSKVASWDSYSQQVLTPNRCFSQRQWKSSVAAQACPRKIGVTTLRSQVDWWQPSLSLVAGIVECRL